MGARTTIQVITILDKRNSTRGVASAPVTLDNRSTCLLAQLVRVVCTLGAVSKKDQHPSRGGFGRGEPGRGRGGGRYGQNRDFGSENTNGYQGGYGGVGSGDGAVAGGGDGERDPRPYRGGGGRRGSYRNGEFGDDSERPPRRNYERHSGTGRGQGMKRDGAGRGNWGSSTDEGLAQ